MSEQLIEQFENLREEMIQSAMKYGLTHPVVIKLSQSLDKLHIEILKEQQQKKNI
ncbi:Spo0E family sporulation regulatory protein-aspartic acid phosphatase [Tepidibacillus infernus]|uniref:aspartyl-phosphate phosphatase Spo0E family protein n=1 Tax=Tepidibacillus TaxID=1494427 RepID=UPI000A07D754|nr:aspartyl-phosphate phosphatase Spo0E family protein [Tepidibacillus sp. HK-1]